MASEQTDQFEETFKCVKCGAHAPFGYIWPVTGKDFVVCRKHKDAADAAFDKAVLSAVDSHKKLL